MASPERKKFAMRIKGTGDAQEFLWAPGIMKKKALGLSAGKVKGGSPAHLDLDIYHQSEGHGTNYRHLNIKRTSSSKCLEGKESIKFYDTKPL